MKTRLVPPSVMEAVMAAWTVVSVPPPAGSTVRVGTKDENS